MPCLLFEGDAVDVCFLISSKATAKLSNLSKNIFGYRDNCCFFGRLLSVFHGGMTYGGPEEKKKHIIYLSMSGKYSGVYTSRECFNPTFKNEVQKFRSE